MKKILVMVAMLATAVAANAAAFNWAAANIYGSDGVTKYSGDAKLYAVINGADTLVSTYSVSGGTVSKTNSGFTSDALVGGTDYDFFFVIEDAGKTFTSHKKNVGALATSTVTISFANMATATQTSGNWKSSGDVPEPTTGLLILFGMAGLALKRKIA